MLFVGWQLQKRYREVLTCSKDVPGIAFFEEHESRDGFLV